LRFGAALLASLVATLSFAITAAADPGPSGPGFTTTPDVSPPGYTQPDGYVAPANDGLGVPAGAIKHVWVIVMENHAYESNFTGLEDNDYLSQTLPKYGAELTHYYGTEHSSLGNYLEMSSGQGPITDDQDDCGADGYTAMSGSVDTSGGSLTDNGNYGQFTSAAGPNAPAGDNGCVYPSTVPTLFNQLDAAHKTWKVYAQDLDAENSNGSSTTPGQNAGTQFCGAPDSTVGPTPSASQSSNPLSSFPNDSSENGSDRYVSKHNPLPWFDSILNSGDCNSSHLANLMDGSSDQLYKDLQSEGTTPDFSYIVPDNCSNGHDAVCTTPAAGSETNNLSGMAANAPTNAPEGTPLNNVGGTYSSDLFLEHVIPEIMKSPAYSDGGLIVVTWDEAYPQFTYSSDSFLDSTVSSATANNSLSNDSAGETLFGRSLNWEPSGPNVPNVQSSVGQQMAGGPGFNEDLDRPGTESSESVPAPLVPCTAGSSSGNGYSTIPTGGCYQAGAGFANNISGSVTVSATASGMISVPSNGSYDNLVAPNSEGETVTLPSGVTGTDVDGGNVYYVGRVTSAGPAAISGGDDTATTDTTSADQIGTSSFQLVDANGNPVSLSGDLSNFTITLGSQSTATDPLYDAFDPTTGGGDSGALLLSPYIKGGTVSNTYYNHYSLLRSLEDIFDVSKGSSSAPGYTGSISLSAGVDGGGHLGYAGQPGLAPFGTDVFTDSPLDISTQTVTTPPVTVTVTGPTRTVTVPGKPGRGGNPGRHGNPGLPPNHHHGGPGWGGRTPESRHAQGR
jgi:Phosphoesterase family